METILFPPKYNITWKRNHPHSICCKGLVRLLWPRNSSQNSNGLRSTWSHLKDCRTDRKPQPHLQIWRHLHPTTSPMLCRGNEIKWPALHTPTGIANISTTAMLWNCIHNHQQHFNQIKSNSQLGANCIYFTKKNQMKQYVDQKNNLNGTVPNTEHQQLEIW